MKKAVSLFALLLLQVCFFAVSAHADTLDEVLKKTCVIRSAMDNGYVIDVDGGGTKDGTNIQLYRYNGTPAQKFVISRTKGGYYKIVNRKSRKAIDVSDGEAGKGVNVQIWEQNWSDAQMFRFEDAGDGYYYIRNKLGYCLDVYKAKCVDGANIQTFTRNGGNNQKWLLTLD